MVFVQSAVTVNDNSYLQESSKAWQFGRMYAKSFQLINLDFVLQLKWLHLFKLDTEMFTKIVPLASKLKFHDSEISILIVVKFIQKYNRGDMMGIIVN